MDPQWKSMEQNILDGFVKVLISITKTFYELMSDYVYP